MKNYKILLISFVLLIFMIGAVSASDIASDDSSIASTDESILEDRLPGIEPIIPDIPIGPVIPGGDDEPVEGEVKDIYVNDTGDDSNTGSSDSPYATIGRAVQDVSEADDATIYIGEGTFSSDDDLNFEIYLNHFDNGNANLKFIGAGTDKTIIDGLSAFRFAHFGEGTNVTLKDITFINCKGGMGGTLYSEGILNVENCIFKDSYATEGVGGAIASGWDWSMGLEDRSSLTVKNSQFINCYSNSIESWMEAHGGGAIFVGQMKSYIENNTFINTAVSEEMGSGAAVLLWVSNGAKVINNKFINITGYTEDAGLNLGGWEGYEVDVINNTFINCTNPSDMYSTVYILSCKVNLENNSFINSTNSVGNYYSITSWFDKLNFQTDVNQINVSNNEINNGISLPIILTDDNGNIVKCLGDFKVQLDNGDNTYILNSRLDNDILKINFPEVPENGLYNLTVLYNNYYINTFDSISDTLAIVNISVSNEPVEFYVSPEGNNENNGTVEYPFATIQHALDVGFEKTFSLIVHLLKGTYSSDDNIQLTIGTKGSLQIIGEVYNQTIIDANNSNWFFNFGSSDITVENLTFINGKSTNRNLISGGTLKDCIINNCSVDGTRGYVVSGSVFDNVTYTNNYGVASLEGNLSNSYFANNNAKFLRGSTGDVMYGGIITFSGVIENCTFINNTSPRGGVIYSSNGVISRNNYYANNKAFVDYDGYEIFYGFGGAIYTSKGTFVNDTFEGNNARNGGVISYYSMYSPMTLSYNFTGCKFINNSADYGGVSDLTVGTFTDCKFINNSADYGGVFSLLNYNKKSEKLELNNVIFDGNTAKIKGNDIYLSKRYSGNNFFPIDLTLNFNDLNISLFTGDVTANVAGPCGAQISGSTIYFVLEGKNIGSAELTNGVATLSYSGFDEGNYTLSGYMSNQADSIIINNGTISVKLEGILDNVTYYVSNNGSDENGNGSQENPFKSISHAVAEASKNCHNITLYVDEGTYTGDLNTALSLSSINNLTVIGAGIGKTIIDGENSTYFAIITEGENRVVISNLTIQNMLPVNVENIMAQRYPKFDGVPTITVYETATLCLDNVNINNCHGGNAIIENKGNLIINNSVLNNNGLSTDFISGGNITIDNTLFDENFVTNSLINGIASINNSEIKNAYILSDTYNQINYCLITGDKLTIENTKISNDGDNSSLKELGYDSESNKLNPAISFYSRDVSANNISMICNYNSESVKEYWYSGSKYKLLTPFANLVAPRNVTVYNSTFRNFNCIWGNYLGEQKFIFDGCVFDNISFIAHIDFTTGSNYNITNSAFINVGPVIDKFSAYYSQEESEFNCTFENNYWGSNDKPVVTFINSKSGEAVYEPDTWIILTSEDEMSVIKNLTDGENITAYTGNAPIRTDYADNNGALDYAVVFGPVGYLFTTDDDKNVIFNPEDAMYPFEAADPMDYRTPSIIAITGFTGDLGIVGILVDPVGNPIANATIASFVNGENVANVTTDEDGAFTVKGIKNGVLTILFNGTVDYFDTEYNLTFANAGKTTKSFINLDTVESDLAIRGTLVDDEGNPIANATITYAVNGANATEVTTDDNGVFTVQGASDSIISIDFNGNDAFDASNINITLKNLSPVRQATLFNSSDFTQYSCDFYEGERGGNFTFQLVDEMGNPIANKTIYIGYNGVTLNRTTDENGFANVQINLKNAGLYTFVIVFLGDEDYNATMAVHKVTIEKKTTSISASAKTYKATAKTKKYTVTLKTIKGSSIDGKTYLAKGKKVTLTINGKTYTAKTNAKGQATFSLKITKKGKFTAKVSFAGDNTYKEANKSVKLTIK